LAANGSDFSIDVPGYSVTAAKAIQCSTGFDMDSVQVTLNKPLAIGNFSLTVRKGSDGNTLLDYCDRSVDSMAKIPFTMSMPLPTPMDSLITPGCGSKFLDLVFRKNINCSSITANGSEFSITGPAVVSITGISKSCSDEGLTNRIRVNF
jgi:hypothetical protein